VGTGAVGPISGRLKDLYFDAVRGRLPRFRHWLTPVYDSTGGASAGA
jgi:branched-chain amino acid aminotransferase